MNQHSSTKLRYRLACLMAIWSAVTLCYGQTSKPDVIVKTDNTRITCRVIGVGKTLIQYRRLTGKSVSTINKSVVSRINYANGKVLIINEIVVDVPVAPAKPKPDSSPETPVSPPSLLDEYVIYLKNGQRIRASSAVFSADNKSLNYRTNPGTTIMQLPVSGVDYVLKPDGTRLAKQQGNEPTRQPNARKFTVQFNAAPTYMLGTNDWTSLTDGLGHAIGVGGTAQFDYWIAKGLSIGTELGYVAWNTQIDVVESRGKEPFYTYRSKATQLLGMAHIRLMLGERFYIMPQGGISLLDVKLSNGEDSDGFRGTQTCYGGAVGGLFRLSRTVNLDASLFYRNAIASKTLQDEYAATPMRYAGLRLGLGFSW